MNVLTKLRRLAKKHSLVVTDCGNGHIQITGGLMVNYYPDSKKQTAYIAGTRNGITHVTPEKAIELAIKPPPISPMIKKRKVQTSRKNRLHKKHPFCNWCEKEVTREESTVDHVIPLHRGGLDNNNNIVLSCEPCNRERGHDMPELKGLG